MNIACNFNNAGIGKHKIPRYLYHFTDSKSLEQINKDGIIKINQSRGDFIRGIFSIELTNFLKYWNKKDSFSNQSLMAKLFQKILSKEQRELVVIRFQTGNLDKSKFLIRLQKDIIDFCKKYVSKLQKGNKLHERILGIPATESKLFEQKKQAIEYIYTDNIPIDFIKIIGKTDISKLTRDEINISLYELLTNIFKNQSNSELKAIKAAKIRGDFNN